MPAQSRRVATPDPGVCSLDDDRSLDPSIGGSNAELLVSLPEAEPASVSTLDAAGLSGPGTGAGFDQLVCEADPAAPTAAPAPRTPIHREVNEQVTEVISAAPDPYGAWNGTYGWTAKFALDLDPTAHTLNIVMRLTTSAAEEVRQGWEQAIEAKWGGGKFHLDVAGAAGAANETYAIGCDVQWVTDAAQAHYAVTANAPGANEGGRAGGGGTTSMTGWGTGDTVDVTHEFGHMLGAKEDYFTTDGVDHTHGGADQGFRDTGGGIMNNPADDPLTRHLDLVRRQAAAALGVPEDRCAVR